MPGAVWNTGCPFLAQATSGDTRSAASRGPGFPPFPALCTELGGEQPRLPSRPLLLQKRQNPWDSAAACLARGPTSPVLRLCTQYLP